MRAVRAPGPYGGAVHLVLASGTTSDFVRITEKVVLAIEAIGIAVLVVGFLVVVVSWLAHPPRWTEEAYHQRVKRGLGRVILLGLEILVAADLIRTVIVEPTLESVAALGLLVVVRTLLAWSITVELEGTWPWKIRGVVRAEQAAAQAARDAAGPGA
jgi:uncharacterized membrane protein